jgi:hypothetical protein
MGLLAHVTPGFLAASNKPAARATAQPSDSLGVNVIKRVNGVNVAAGPLVRPPSSHMVGAATSAGCFNTIYQAQRLQAACFYSHLRPALAVTRDASWHPVS